MPPFAWHCVAQRENETRREQGLIAMHFSDQCFGSLNPEVIHRRTQNYIESLVHKERSSASHNERTNNGAPIW